MSNDFDDLDVEGGDQVELDPTEIAGPEECQTGADDTLVDPEAAQSEPHETLFEASDELQDAFVAEELATPIAADGLPDHSADPVGDGAVPFTIEGTCCIADDRTYVEMFRHELVRRHWELVPVDQGISGQDLLRGVVAGWLVPRIVGERHSDRAMLALTNPPRYDDRGEERERRVYQPDQIVKRWGQTFVEDAENDVLIAVRPIRERCRFYAQQHFATDEQPDPSEPGHNVFYRFCTHPARRSIGGASLSLGNQAIYGCDLRDPHDEPSLAFMREADRKRLHERPDKVRLPLFGLEGDEVHVQDDPRTGGGIFSK